MAFRVLSLAAALALWSASACVAEPGDWPGFKAGPERAAFNPDETKLGVANVSGLVQKWKITTEGEFNESPAVVGGVVYAASSDDLAAYDAETAKRLWRRKLKIPGASSPTVVDGVVYVALEGASVMAIDASNGKTKWTAKTASFRDFASLSSPVVAGSLVYVGGADGKLYALKKKNGKLAFAAKTSKGNRTPILAAPAFSDGVLYVPSKDGRLYALNAKNGKLVWSYKSKGSLEETAAVSDGRVYFADDFGNRLYVLDAKTGKEVWVKSLPNRVSTPAIAGDRVYVTAGNAIALDAATGAQIWSGLTGQSGIGPSVANGVTYALNLLGRFAAFNAATGASLKVILLSDQAHSTPVVSNGVLYLVTDSAITAFAAP